MKRSTQAMLGAAGCLGAYAAYRVGRAYSRQTTFFGRVVVITGGSRGLGLVMARQLAREGARLAICARDPAEVSSALADLRRLNAEVVGGTCDVTRREEIPLFINAVREQLGPIDVLINNAGIIQVGPLATMTRDDFEQAMAVHFWGPLDMIDAVLPDMRRRGRGRIVNISSVGGQVAVPHLLPYCASKFALTGYSDGLGTELAKEGIYVTTVCPGLMRTGSPRNAKFKGQHRREYTWFSLGASLPLVTVSAEHAARAIISACRHGRAKLTIGLPAKVAAALARLAPELTADLSSLVDRTLPGRGGIGLKSLPGHQSTTSLSPSLLTTLNEKAAERNNEVRSELA